MKGQERLKGHASLQFNFRLMGCRCLTPVSGRKRFMSDCGWLLTGRMLPQVHASGKKTSNISTKRKVAKLQILTLLQRWVHEVEGGKKLNALGRTSNMHRDHKLKQKN